MLIGTLQEKMSYSHFEDPTVTICYIYHATISTLLNGNS
jgi:hypothetical protein